MTVEPHHTPGELKTLYRTEMNARVARRIQGVYLARMGRTCPEIMRITAPAIGKMVEREFGVLYSIRGIERVLRRLGFSYLSPRPKHEKSDTQAQEAFKKTSRKCWLKSPSNIPANE